MIRAAQKKVPTLVSTDSVYNKLRDIRVLDGSMGFGGSDFEADFEKQRIPGAQLLRPHQNLINHRH